MFYHSVLDGLNEVDVYSVMSLKHGSTCRHVTYFKTNTYFTLCHTQKIKDKGTKDERLSLLYSHHIYEGVTYFGMRWHPISPWCFVPHYGWKWCNV